MRILFIFFLVFILGFCANTFGQNPYIRHYTTLDGLPSNTIYQIYQDSHKFLWFTSDAGVTKFDGSNFINYRKKDGLSSNDVVRIKEDSKGRIWIFSYNGSVNYIYNNIIYNSKNAPFLNSMAGKGFILDFFTGSDQTIYFYNWQRELFSLDTNNIVLKDFLFKNKNLPKIKKLYHTIKVLYLSKSNSNKWVIWTDGGIFSKNNQNGDITVSDSGLMSRALFPVSNKEYYSITNSGDLIKVTGNFQKEKIHVPFDPLKIKTILEDSEGYLWIAAYDEGVYCLKNNKVVRHFDIEDALGLLQDHEQNIWISTESDGIYVINHDILEQNHFDRTNFDNYSVNMLCDFPGTGIWCTNTKAAYLLKSDIFYKLSVPEAAQPVNLVYQFKDQTLLLGTISGKLSTFANITLISATSEIGYSKIMMHPVFTKKIITDRSGKVAAMFDQNSILFTSTVKPTLNTEYNQISERINNAYYNAKNEFVINANRNYLYRSNELKPYSELSRFNGTIITDHLVLDDSTELFNIDGDSLYVLKNHKFYNLSEAFDSPINSQINKFLYEDSTLYISTLKNIFVCYNPGKVISGIPIQLKSLNISFNNINDILIHKDTLYIASDDGLTVIAETSVAKSIGLPPIPYLQSITVNDKTYSSPDQRLTLTGKNNIKLSFGCISYSASPIIYSYMLEGAEDTWTVGSGSNINLVYHNLPKGHYIFKLRVRKLNSGWSKPLELPITIKPILVEYPAFWAFIVILASGLIFLIISMIRTQKMKRTEVDHQLIVMEQKALQSMMNPHFIFNSLGSIQNYLLKNKGSEAVIYLSQFAQLIRQNLDAINTPMINLEEEIGRMRNYLELEKIRLENKFDYSIEIDTEFEEDQVFIPSMMIQPIAENSIWHGLATLEGMGFIKIRFHAYKPKSLKIIIEDNGIGMKKALAYSATTSHRQHLGMKIIEKRLKLLSKKYSTVTSINYSECTPGNNNPGTLVELVLPFIYNIDDF
ncbi:MAG: histidine kinase [Lentimicrobiaceae bacterium]